MTDLWGNVTPIPDDYTIWDQYDDLYQIVRGILPYETPQDLSDNPTISLEYDPR